MGELDKAINSINKMDGQTKLIAVVIVIVAVLLVVIFLIPGVMPGGETQEELFLSENELNEIGLRYILDKPTSIKTNLYELQSQKGESIRDEDSFYDLRYYLRSNDVSISEFTNASPEIFSSVLGEVHAMGYSTLKDETTMMNANLGSNEEYVVEVFVFDLENTQKAKDAFLIGAQFSDDVGIILGISSDKGEIFREDVEILFQQILVKANDRFR